LLPLRPPPRPLLTALAALAALALPAGAPRRAAAESDARLLFEGNPARLRPTALTAWPLVDLRPLFEGAPGEGQAAGGARARERVQGALLAQLSAYGNLALRPPPRALEALTAAPAYARTVELARGLARRGVQAYREVELEQAQAQLESALELFEQCRQREVDPREVAQVTLTLGFVLLEQRHLLRAAGAFESALLLNPRLRLRADFDGPLAYKTFEEARARLTSLSAEELTRLAEPSRAALRRGEHALWLWLTPSGVSATLAVWRGEHMEVRREREGLGGELGGGLGAGAGGGGGEAEEVAAALSRLAGRLWACVPLQRLGADGDERTASVYAAGPGGLLFLRRPVGLVAHVGVEGVAARRVTRWLYVLGGASWSVSGRDAREDLRGDLSVASGHVGSRWVVGGELGEEPTASAAVSLEALWRSAALLSREVGCKFFPPSPTLPPQLCQPSVDLSPLPASLQVGPRVELALTLPLRRPLYAELAAGLSWGLYQLTETPFTLPLTLSLRLGFTRVER